LMHDKRLEIRLQAFRTLAVKLDTTNMDFTVLSSLLPIDELNRQIFGRLSE